MEDLEGRASAIVDPMNGYPLDTLMLKSQNLHSSKDKVNTMMFVPCSLRIWGVNSKPCIIEDCVLRDRVLQGPSVHQCMTKLWFICDDTTH